jgi:hypothetical protein
MIKRLIFKDAGVVYESLRNETNRVIWEKFFYETNPRNGYFKKISTNPNHDTGNL